MVNGDPWFKGREAARMIQYQNTKQAIRIHVDDDDKMKFEDLLETRRVPVGGVAETPPGWNDRNTIYISMRAVFTV